jgi:hypothetical protein
LLKNEGDGGFVSDYLLVPAVSEACNGAVWGDYDSDGDLDLYLVNEGQPNRLLRNEIAADNHWLQVDLVGTDSNAMGVGTRLRLVAGGQLQIRDVTAQTRHYGQDALRASFGLGATAIVDSLEVHWPSGIVQLLRNIAANQVLTIVEGDQTPVMETVTLPAVFRLWPSQPNPCNPRTTISYELPAATRVTLRVYDAAGRLVKVLADEAYQGAGRHSVQWEGIDQTGRSVSSGVYFVHLAAGGFRQTGKVALLK